MFGSLICILLLLATIYANQEEEIINQKLLKEIYKATHNWYPEARFENLPKNDYEEPYGSEQEEDYTDDDREFDASLPYGIQNVRDVTTGRQTRVRAKGSKIGKITFQSLCQSQRNSVYLNNGREFEYRPDHYEEVTCNHGYTNHLDYKLQKNKVCGEAGFSCIQLNRTIFLTRKPYGSECWESETRLVAAGCECMWPKHHFGDITSHH